MQKKLLKYKFNSQSIITSTPLLSTVLINKLILRIGDFRNHDIDFNQPHTKINNLVMHL